MESAEENLNIALGQLLMEEDEQKYKIPESMSKFIKFNDELGFSPLKVVHRAYDAEYGKEVLWHTIKARKISAKQLSKIHSEISLMKFIKHSNVLNCIDFWIKVEQKQIVFITQIMDGGCLRIYLDKIKTTKLKVIKGWCLQILKGLNYLHEQQKPIYHKSLRCDNIYINSSTNQIKLGEIGCLFTSLDPFQSLLNYFEWTAPELMQQKHSTFSDIYSFGMTLLELITGKKPYYQCSNYIQFYKKISNNIKPKSLQDVSLVQLRKIIQSCINTDPSLRPSIKQLLQNDFWKSVQQTDNSIITLFNQQKHLTINKLGSKHTNRIQKNTKLNEHILKIQSDFEIKFVFEFSKKKYQIKLQKQTDEQFEQFVDYLTKRLEQKMSSKDNHSYPFTQNKFEQRQLNKQDYTHFLSSQNPTMKTMRFDYLYQSRSKDDDHKKSSSNLSQYHDQGQNDILVKIQQLFIGMYEMYRNKLQSWHIEQSSHIQRFEIEKRQLQQLQSIQKQRVMIKRKDKSNQAFLANSINFIDFLNNSEVPWPTQAYQIQKDIMIKNALMSSGKPQDVLSLNFSSIHNYRQEIHADFEQYILDQQQLSTNPKLNQSFIQQKQQSIIKTKTVLISQIKEQIVRQQQAMKFQEEQVKIKKLLFEKKQSIKSVSGKEKQKQKQKIEQDSTQNFTTTLN